MVLKIASVPLSCRRQDTASLLDTCLLSGYRQRVFGYAFTPIYKQGLARGRGSEPHTRSRAAGCVRSSPSKGAAARTPFPQKRRGFVITVCFFEAKQRSPRKRSLPHAFRVTVPENINMRRCENITGYLVSSELEGDWGPKRSVNPHPSDYRFYLRSRG